MTEMICACDRPA